VLYVEEFMIKKIRGALWPVALLFALFVTRTALAHDGPHLVDVPYGGDSLLPLVMIFLTFIFVGIAALWMFRSGR
jgi:hypothetical protein